MSESNLVDTISEAFSNAIKKTNIFEKFIEIKRISFSFIVIVSITGATLLFYEVYNSYGIEKIVMKTVSIENRVSFLNKKIDKLIETNTKLNGIIILNNKLLNKYIENQLLYICDSNNIKIENFKNSDINTIEEDIKNIIEDNTNYDEVLNECYDNIACNNSKKNIVLNKFFNWF